MITLNTKNYYIQHGVKRYKAGSKSVSFCGDYTIRAASTIKEKAKVHISIFSALIDSLYPLRKNFFQKFLSSYGCNCQKISESWKILALMLKKYDIKCIFNEKGKIIGGFLGRKSPDSYSIDAFI